MAPTKTPETKTKYLERVKQLINRYKKESEYHHDIDYIDMIEWLIILVTTKKPSTKRQYYNAMRFYFEVNGLYAEIEYLNTTEKFSSYNDWVKKNHKTPKSTSSKKRKSVSRVELKKLKETHRPKNYWERVAMTKFLATILTGLRPCEWETAKLIRIHRSNIKDLPDIALPILRVKNAKHTNGRSHGEYRHLSLAEFPPPYIDTIKRCIDNVRLRNYQNWKQEISYSEYQEKCSDAFSRIYRRAYPRRKTTIALYSARHQFIADCKFSGMSLFDIAALAGHGSNETATEHYGRKRSGSTRPLPSATPEESNRVKDVYESRSQKKATKKKPKRSKGPGI